MKRPELVQRLTDAAAAYPADIFTPLTAEQTKEHAAIVTRASAQMGRHFSPLLTEAADRLRQLEAKLEAAERDAADARNGWARMTAEAGALQLRHVGKHEGDVYHAMQGLCVRFGSKWTGPLTQPIDAAANQGESNDRD